MRFLPEGPSVPHELLVARDQGRVVFFCGSGVSIANAKLDDFFGLARKVVDNLGVQSDSRALQLLELSAKLTQEDAALNVVSADHIFGELENEFSTHDIHQAVCQALRTDADVDLTAHKTMVRLSTTRDGHAQLITTNLERLIEQCDKNLPSYTRSDLPKLMQMDTLNGIVHLHGRTNQEGSNSDAEGFVLSTSEFGEAYLSNGWATQFVKHILEQYVVVFVGYSADDPPLKYLLEALNKESPENRQNKLYAFQIDSAPHAIDQWKAKGVEAIPFSDYGYLWQTLSLWANRADDPDQWYQDLIVEASVGPENLLPYIRGQVAHMVSSVEGARALCESPSLPASWLNVFDSKCRYMTPNTFMSHHKKTEIADSFTQYGLDSDPRPQLLDSSNVYSKREIPSSAWDAFSLTPLDRMSLKDEY